MDTKLYPTDDKSVTTMIRSVLAAESTSREGQATYLRTLTAAVQAELGAGPVLFTPRRKTKAVPTETALEALEKAHGRFYGLVMLELNGDAEGLGARERNAQTGFARSAASTLRAALRLGLNPLTIVIPEETKESLRAWIREHQPPIELDRDTASRKARGLINQLASMLEGVPEDDRSDVLEQFRSELAALEAKLQYVPPERRRTMIERRRAEVTH